MAPNCVKEIVGDIDLLLEIVSQLTRYVFETEGIEITEESYL